MHAKYMNCRPKSFDHLRLVFGTVFGADIDFLFVPLVLFSLVESLFTSSSVSTLCGRVLGICNQGFVPLLIIIDIAKWSE